MFKRSGIGLFVLGLALVASAGGAQTPPATPAPGPEDARVVLDCLAGEGGKLSDCRLVSETPEGEHFGQAALAMAQVGVTSLKSTTPVTPGQRVQVPLTFPKQAGAAAGPRRLASTTPPVFADTVGTGEAIVTLPYAFRRTGVLKADVTGYSITVRGVLAPAGTVGFYAGSFSSVTSPGPGDEVWCFLQPPDSRRPKPLCLMLKPQRKLAAMLPKVDPFDIREFDGYSPNYANLPEIDEKPVDIPGDLKIVYRFAGWKGDAAAVERWVNGRKAETLKLRKGPDGAVTLWTFAGEYRLTPASGDPGRAKVIALGRPKS